MNNQSELKKLGLKVTAPRLKILKILETSPKRHLSAENIYHKLKNQGDDVGLATVYRVLTQFESADLVCRQHFEEGHSVFELNSGEHHDHILCVRCHEVEEFFDQALESKQKSVAKNMGYEITGHSLYLYGICTKCKPELNTL